MKIKNYLILITLIIAGVFNTKAQVTYAKYSDYKLIKKRPLLVITEEIDQKNMQKLEKKLSKTKRPKRIKKIKEAIEERKNFVETYNTNIKKLVEKYLNFHPKVEYMSRKEYNKNYKKLKKQKKYVVLWYSESKKNYENQRGFFENTDASIPTINYSRIEKGKYKVDYSFFVPSFGKNFYRLTPTNMELTFRLMKKHIDYIVKNKKKKLTFLKYAKEMAKKNCNNLNGDIYLAKESLPKNANLSKINANYSKGKVHAIPHDELEKIIDNQEDKIVGVVVPTGIAGKAAARVMFAKILYNPSNNTIYTVKGAGMGEFYDGKFRAKEFKKYGKCKK